MELVTYRYHGHSMSDPGTSYRTRDEVKEMRQTYDPITSLRNKMLEAGFVTKEDVKVGILLVNLLFLIISKNTKLYVLLNILLRNFLNRKIL